MNKKILSLLVALSLVACGKVEKENTQDVSSKPTIKIGVVYPMTGNAAFFGEGAKKAAEMFFAQFDMANSKYNYQLIYEDSQANAAKGVMAARKLIDYDKVNVIFDCMSNVANAISPVANASKVIHLTFAQDRSISTGQYSYRVVTSNKKTGEKMLAALKKRGLHKVVGVVENGAGTLSLFNGFRDVLADDKDIHLVDVWEINPNERDLNIMLQKIKSLAPDAVVVSLHSPLIEIFIKQAKNNELEMPIVGLQSFSFLKDKNVVNGGWYVDVAFADKKFLADYKERFGDDVTNFAENFYTLLQVATHTFESATVAGKQIPTSEEFVTYLDVVNGLLSPVGKLSLDRAEQNVDSEASVRLIQDGVIVAAEE